jgi:hypothetical protein
VTQIQAEKDIWESTCIADACGDHALSIYEMGLDGQIQSVQGLRCDDDHDHEEGDDEEKEDAGDAGDSGHGGKVEERVNNWPG